MYNLYSQHFDDGAGNVPPGHIFGGIPLDKVADGARAILFSDDPCCGESLIESWLVNPHNHGINVSYTDGHVAWEQVPADEWWCCVNLLRGRKDGDKVLELDVVPGGATASAQ